MSIPSRLRDLEFNFVLLGKKSKKPFENGWQKKEIKWNDKALTDWITQGGNYGIIGGGNANLVLVDFDDKDVEIEVVPKLPKTFTTKSGSGGLHKYFKSNNSKSFKILDEEKNTIADIQGTGKQVVGPGSTHPNGNLYTIEDNTEIAFIDYDELRNILEPYGEHTKKVKLVAPQPATVSINIASGDFFDRLLNSITMQEVLYELGVDTRRNPTTCPFHDSKGGKCLSFENEVAHCFHCEGSWNKFSLLKEGLKLDAKDTVEWLADKKNMTDELNESRKEWSDNQIKNNIDFINSLSKKKETELNNISIEEKLAIKNLLLARKEDDVSEAIASRIINNNKIYTTRDDIKSEIWFYHDGIYVPNGRSRIQEISRIILEEAYTSQRVNKIIAKIEADTMIEQDDFFTNRNINEIPVQNGILNIFTRELTEFTPNKIFFNKMPVKYDKEKTCQSIEKFFSDILKSPEDAKVMFEVIGFCLLRDYIFEKAIMFVGDGRNGKGKTLSLIKHFLGIESCCGVPLSQLTPGSTSVCELHSKLANLAGDLSNTDLKDTGMFKQLTGRDLISARRKYLRDLNFENYAKLIFACNELPRVYDYSKGFWSRWILFEFPYRFVNEIEMETLTEKEKESAKPMDVDIIRKITTPDELSGLLNKSLDALNIILGNKNFSYSKGTTEIKDLWVRKSDSFTAFCLDMIEEDFRARINKNDLRRQFSIYCKIHKIRGASDKAIKITLENEYGVYEHQDFNDGSRYWEGIKFKIPIPNDEKTTPTGITGFLQKS